MYVLKKVDWHGGSPPNWYVALPGSKCAYTPYLQHARVYATRQWAEDDRCPDNERVVPVSQEVNEP